MESVDECQDMPKDQIAEQVFDSIVLTLREVALGSTSCLGKTPAATRLPKVFSHQRLRTRTQGVCERRPARL